MKTRVSKLLGEATNACQSPDAYGLLPDIVRILELIRDELESDNPDPETLVQGAGALGRVVTDSYVFSESPLGTKLLELGSDIVSKYDSSWPYR